MVCFGSGNGLVPQDNKWWPKPRVVKFMTLCGVTRGQWFWYIDFSRCFYAPLRSMIIRFGYDSWRNIKVLLAGIRPRYHFVYAPSQWETTLQYNAVSHWLGGYTKRSLWCITFYLRSWTNHPSINIFRNNQIEYNITVGERTVALKIIVRCSITQTLTGQSKVWWWHVRKMVVIYFKWI